MTLAFLFLIVLPSVTLTLLFILHGFCVVPQNFVYGILQKAK